MVTGKTMPVRVSMRFLSDGAFEYRSLFVPLLDADFEVIKSGLTFNYGEFAIIKIRVEHRLPRTKVFERVSIS